MELSKEDQDKMVLKHLNLVCYIAKSFVVSWQTSFDDHVNSGVLGLIDAIQKYDPEKGASFKTYVYYRIKGAIQDNLKTVHIKSESDRKNNITVDPVEFIENIHFNNIFGYQFEDFFIQTEYKNILLGLVEKLDTKDKFIIKSFFKDQAMNKIGEMLEVSESRVSQKITEIKGKLKKQFKLSCLRNEIT